MTGTAKTEEEEFKQIYALPVLVIPTNMPLRREAKPDLIFRSEGAKFEAIADEVETMNRAGRPVLIGTNSIEKSERLARLFTARKLSHQVLNAKHHEREAEIIAGAGQHGAITVATNMAGRGTDIKLEEGVAELGGLHVMGCQRHESRRIDNQLLGRAGRQGDPGSSQFYLSLEDDLLRIFGGDRIAGLMERLGMEEGEAIEHDLLTGAIRRAQKRVEGRNFEIRKRLLEYDLVLAKQREAIYALRDRFLLPEPGSEGTAPPEEQADLDEYLGDLFEEIAENLVAAYAPPRQPPEEWNLEGLAKELAAYGPISPSSLEAADREGLIAAATDHLKEALASQKARLGVPFPLVARYLVLTSLDEAWRTHLYTLDDLKGGIGWTALAGTDPLVAFKRESFALFQEMLGSTAEKIVRVLLNPRLTLSTGQAQSRAPERLSYVHPDSAPPGGRGAPRPQQPGARRPVRAAKTPGRNDPCPCGSGKKYKKCCGRDR
jgi:preprotein translocase subunit SecA